MKWMKRVVVCGSAVIDVLVSSKDLKVMKSHMVSGGVAMCEVYGGKSEAEEIILETGGAGTNVAVGLARLDKTVSVVARIGKDWVGERVISALNVAGIDTGLLQIDQERRTGLSVVLVANDGGRSIITNRGVSKEIEINLIDAKKIKVADWMQISSLGGKVELVEDMVGMKGAQTKIGWNPGIGELNQKERVWKILKNIDVLFLNRMEASKLLEGEFLESKLLAKKIIEKGAKMVVITDGIRGAGVAVENNWYEADAFKSRSVDDTGAGDAFVSGFVSGLLEDVDILTALKRGLVNGASVVTYLGAKDGLLTKKKMAKWLQKRLRMREERL